MHICTKRSPERQGHALLLHPHHYLCFACRYMRVYNAAIKDRAFTYAIFFMFFFIHIIFCVWSAISPPLPFSNDCESHRIHERDQSDWLQHLHGGHLHHWGLFLDAGDAVVPVVPQNGEPQMLC